MTELAIAFFVEDSFIRPYFGDFLVVILIYCFIKSFFNISVTKAAIFVLLFSFLVEGLQYFNFISILGLEKVRLAKMVLGSNFSWADILIYILGIIFVVSVEKAVSKKKAFQSY